MEHPRPPHVHVLAAVSGFHGADVLLADGDRVARDAVIVAAGYRSGLEPLVGHLGVLREDGWPRVTGAHTVEGAPGMWFTGSANPISGALREPGIDGSRIA